MSALFSLCTLLSSSLASHKCTMHNAECSMRFWGGEYYLQSHFSDKHVCLLAMTVIEPPAPITFVLFEC
uniref:Putative secreted protein n=1 Tax=Anopheles darlingi TaxID=43151 RepID=A0A2M4DB23_ANODA